MLTACTFIIKLKPMKPFYIIAVLCFSFFAKAQAPVNDEPASATILTPSAILNQNAVAATTIGATQTTNPGTVLTDTDDDVWFKLPSGTGGNHLISLSNVVFSNAAIDNQIWIKLWQKNGAVWTPYSPTTNGYYNTDNLGPSLEWYIQIYTIDVTARATFSIAAKMAQTIFPAPANDDCAAPIVLTSAASCSNIYGTNINATNSTQPFAVVGTGKDVWYKFTAQTAFNTITLSNIHLAPDATYPIYPFGAGTSNLQIEIGNLNCGAYTALANSNMQPTLTVNNLVPTQEYLVRVAIINTQHIRFADYNICIQHAFPPSNDEPATATNIIAENGNCYNATNTINANTMAATESSPPHCQAGTIYDTWYSFTATNNLFRAKLIPTSSIQPPVLEVWNSTLTTRINCINSTEIEANVTIGQNYYLRVAAYANTYFNAFSLNALCTTIPQVNNNCSAATLLPQPIINGATASLVMQSTAGANQNINAPLANAGCGTEVGGDLWYSFTALKNAITIRTANVAPVGNTMLIQLYANDCNSNTPIASSCGGVLIASLVPGTTYLIRVLPIDGCDNVTFDLNVQVPPSPINDNCSGAITLPYSDALNVPHNNLNGTNVNATTSIEALSTGCAPYSNISDVWYKFTTGADATNIQIVVSDIVQNTAGSGFLAYSLHSGSCATLVNENCDLLSNFTPNILHFNLTSNTTYYFRLFGTNYQNQFSYKLHWRKIHTATNTICASATTIVATSNQSAIFTEGNTFAPADEIDCINAGFGAVNRGVWYKFTATATKHLMDVTSVIPLSVNGAFAEARVFSGTCAGLAQLFCFGQIQTTDGLMNGLTIGQDYFILVLGNTLNSGEIAFKIRVVGATTPSNDESVGAITLVQNPECSNPTSGTFNYSGVSALPVLPTVPAGNTYTFDVWYKFTAVANSVSGNLNLTGSFNNCKLIIYNDALTTTILDNDFMPMASTNFNVAGLTVGQNYYIRLVQFNATATGTTGSENNFSICIYGMPTTNIANNAAAYTACHSADGSVISTNSNTWLHLTDGGNMVASILDNGGAMGIINASYFTSGTVRSNAGLEYLNRNFDITPTIQPTTPVQVRLYFTRAELLALIGVNDGDFNDVYDVTDLFVNKFSSTPCATTIAGSGGVLYPVTSFGTIGVNDYFLQITIPSFSSFFIHTPTSVVLPITLNWFNGTSNNGINNLQWKVFGANNFSHFEIEKSSNGTQFNKIAVLQLTTNSIYNYQDITNETISFYRLKMMNTNGTFSYSNIVKLTNVGSKIKMILTNNPITTNNLNLIINAEKTTNTSFTIYNMMGQRMDVINKSVIVGNQTIQLNIKNLISGNYIVESIIDGKKIKKQFVKM